MKATLVLLPLLGITYMLFFVNPGGEDEVAQIVFIYFNSILESFQVCPGPTKSVKGFGNLFYAVNIEHLKRITI